jgi:hypothetical protein
MRMVELNSIMMVSHLTNSEERLLKQSHRRGPRGKVILLRMGMDTRVIVGEAAGALEVLSNHGNGSWPRVAAQCIITVNRVRFHDIEFETTGIEAVRMAPQRLQYRRTCRQQGPLSHEAGVSFMQIPTFSTRGLKSAGET